MSRALAVQARALELYSLIDLADAVIEHEWRTIAANLWVAGEKTARRLRRHGCGAHPFPYALVFPQDAAEQGTDLTRCFLCLNVPVTCSLA